MTFRKMDENTWESGNRSLSLTLHETYLYMDQWTQYNNGLELLQEKLGVILQHVSEGKNLLNMTVKPGNNITN